MKKKIFFIVFVLSFMIINIGDINATSDKLRGDSITTCNGVNYGQHGDGHWHVATQHDSGWYPNGASLGYENPCATNESVAPIEVQTTPIVDQNSNNTPAPVQTYVPSSNTSLQAISIGDDSLSISDDMTYTTTSESISLNVVASDSKTALTVSDTSALKIGNNEVTITATAEDGTVKYYKVNVKRDKIKSTDNTLKSLTIDSESIEISDTMNVTAKYGSSDVQVYATDENATVSVSKVTNLKIGDNVRTIKVTAEDGSAKEYTLNIKRLSANVDLKVRINNEKIELDSFEGELSVSHDIDSIKVDYTLDDERSSAKLSYDEKLSDGDNIVVIKVTAENGYIQEYQITVKRTSLFVEILSYIILGIMLIGIVGGSYLLVKRIKKKKMAI